MRKSGLLILILLFLVGSLCVVGATRIYGNVEAQTDIKLTVGYTANGEKIDGQTVRLTSNNIGDWEYKINSDDGTIDLKVNYKEMEREFSVPTGQDFQVLLLDDTTQSQANVNDSTTENATEETNTSSETSSEETNNSTEENSEISGKAVSETDDNSKNKNILSGSLNIFLLAVGLFVMIFIANILSSLALDSFRKRVKRNRAEMPIRVVKLSAKLDEAQRQLGKAQQEIRKVIQPRTTTQAKN